jgi:hypothetical protein
LAHLEGAAAFWHGLGFRAKRKEFYMRNALLVLTVMALGLSACSTLRRVGDAVEQNPAPCPSAYALLDAGRKVQFVGGSENFESVGFTAEIEEVRSLCVYRADGGPILASLEIDMSFGRGPSAAGRSADYPFFVAVTRKNSAVIDKQVFSTRVSFPRGTDTVFKTETLREIAIPRASESVAGTNFEIIVGFELDERELAFNRDGKRFLIDSNS